MPNLRQWLCTECDIRACSTVGVAPVGFIGSVKTAGGGGGVPESFPAQGVVALSITEPK